MATTSLSLGEHWEVFIKNEVSKGRYGSASEVVRDALRHMEEKQQKFLALRAAIIEGEESGEAMPLDMDKILTNAKKKAGLND